MKTIKFIRKHSPGPFKVYEYDHDWYLLDANDRQVIDLQGYQDEDTNEANWNLLSVSPDMADLLIKIATKIYNASDKKPMAEWQRQEFDEIISTIEKAGIEVVYE